MQENLQTPEKNWFFLFPMQGCLLIVRLLILGSFVQTMSCWKKVC